MKPVTRSAKADKSSSIWWIRRDLRLSDNQALSAAVNHSERIIPVFILDDHLLRSRYSGEKRLEFLFGGLRRLDEDLRQRGSRLILRKGSPERVLRQLLQESNANAIYAETDHSPYARKRDGEIQDSLPLRLVGSTAILSPGSVTKPDGDPYTVFTPFSRAWLSQISSGLGKILPAPERINTPTEISREDIQSLTGSFERLLFAPGEAEGQRRLQMFLEGGDSAVIYHYGEGRNLLDQEGTSKISPYLRFGMLSARAAARQALSAIENAPHAQARKSAETWLNEIIWREFYIHILYHFPQVRRQNFRQMDIRWENDKAKFIAWCQGQTGYPIVDAAMRQLRETGWMHNRGRMIVASFLTKDLLIDWQWGEEWFMQHLIDGDPAANNGGWQWTAGTGTDAAPYFRIFNPISQSQKYDPQGGYIRRWIPELRNVPDEFVHEPWKMPAEIQSKTGCKIGKDYPSPIIDHAWARERALDIYSKAKK